MRDSVVFYRSFWEAIEDLSDGDFKQAVTALMQYALDDTEPDVSGAAKTFFRMAKPQIDANNQKYENGKRGGRPPKYSKEEREESKKARNTDEYKKWRDAVYKRDGYKCVLCGSANNIEAHHKKGFVDFPELRYSLENGITLCDVCHNRIHNSENQNGKVENQIKPNTDFQKPNVNVNDNVNDIKENTLKGVKEKRFAPPTLENVMGYCQEKGYNIDAERFIDFYESKGWMVGKNKMKDWKAAIRNWARQDKDEKRGKSAQNPAGRPTNRFQNFEPSNTDYGALVNKKIRERMEEGG